MRATALADATIGPYTADAADALTTEVFDTEVLAKQGYRNEHLDQLVVELILGLRSASRYRPPVLPP